MRLDRCAGTRAAAGAFGKDRAIFTSTVNFCWSLFRWCLLLLVVIALAVGGYLYFRLDDEICRQVELRLENHYRELDVRVGSARFEQDRGIAVYDVVLLQRMPEGPPQPIVLVEELYLAGKLRIEELMGEELPISQIIIRRAELRAVRGRDGGWNVKTLLPLPNFSAESPLVTIEDATVVLDHAASVAAPARLHGIHLTLTPVDLAEAPEKDVYRVTGTSSGVPAREFNIGGQLCTNSGELDLHVMVAGLEVSSELLAAVPGASVEQIRDADFSGRADVSLQVKRAGFQQAPSWTASVKLARGRLAHPLLPMPLTELECEARADGEQLHIDRLVASCGPGGIVLALTRAGWAPNAPLALAAKLERLPLNDELREILPPAAQRAWERFQPRGSVDAEVRVRFDGSRWQPQFIAHCRNVSLTDAIKFPYRLERTAGVVEYSPAQPGQADRFKLDLTGTGGGRPVRIQAELVQLHAAPPAHPVGWVDIAGEDIPIHEQLIAAMPENGETLVRALRPQGLIDFHFRAEWKTPTQPIADVTQEIRLKNCTIIPVEFPFTLRQVQGLVTERDDCWTIHDVEGRGASDSTVIKCRGTTVPRGDELHTDLIIEATDVGLDDNLKMALPEEAQQLWNELRPQGRIDFTARVVQESDEPRPTVSARIESRDSSVSIEPVAIPYRVDQIQGVATYAGGHVRLENISGRHDRALYSAAGGTWQPAPGGGWQVELTGVNADRLTPRDILVALPVEMQRSLERLQPSGTFTIYNSALTLAKSPRAPRPTAAWDVRLVAHQAQIRGGTPLQSATGEIHLVGRDDGERLAAAGELALDSLVWKDVQLTNIRGPVWIEPGGCLFGEAAAHQQGQTPRRITADAYGGSLTANAELKHDELSSFSLDLAVGGASLARFANERLGGPKQMNGTVSGRLILSGNAQSHQSMRGLGEFHVVDANIYELPPLVAMLKVLRNRTPNTTAFTRCDTQFTIDGEHVQFQQLNLLGDAVSLYGKGESGLNRELDLVFYTLIEPANLPSPLWKAIAGQVSKQTLQLKVAGTWDRVEVQPQTLPAVNQVLEQLQAGAATITPAIATRETASGTR